MLTYEERAELDMVAYLGLDILRSDDPAAKHPCWLCCSEEVKQAARTRAVAFLNEKAIAILVETTTMLTPISEETANDFLRANMTPIIPAYERWVQLEADMKQEREKGNPSAYFMDAR